jgi:hypothetical protein
MPETCRVIYKYKLLHQVGHFIFFILESLVFFASFNSVFLYLVPYTCDSLAVTTPSFITTSFSLPNQHPKLLLAYATGTNADSQRGVHLVHTFTTFTPTEQ